MKEAIEVTEKAIQAMEKSDTFGTGIASGFQLVCNTIRASDSFKEGCSAFREYPAMIPLLLDRVARYNKIDPGKYEHLNDTTMLAFLLLVEDVYGAASMELRILMVAADLLPNPWWTRQFIERMRAASQSGP